MNDPRLQGVKMVYYGVSEFFPGFLIGGGLRGFAPKPEHNIRGFRGQEV
jgi:hypothetical protein